MTTAKDPHVPAFTRTELVWPGKTNVVERVALPFQVAETVNQSRATREQSPMFAQDGRPSAGDWTNKLIWGDNKYILSSLLNGDPSIGLEPLAGKVDLIYIDPPFATGQDFSYNVRVGDETWEKEANLIEEKAYRDTWGKGMESYLQMMYERLMFARELLCENGSLYLHCDSTANAYLRLMLDSVFGSGQFRNEIIWSRSGGKSDANRYGRVSDRILYYAKGNTVTWNPTYLPLDPEYVRETYQHDDYDGRGPYTTMPLHAAGTTMSESGKAWRGYSPSTMGNHWRTPTQGIMAEYIIEHGLIPDWPQAYPTVHGRLDAIDEAGLIAWSKNGVPRLKTYLAATKGIAVTDIINDIPMASGNERLGYPTQKPFALIERIMKASSNEGALVLDFFAGSGTTLAVAEQLNRRWIGCDLSRYAIQVTRKRMLDIEGCRPFQLLNLGRYERQHWQVNILNGHHSLERAVAEYCRFILMLYKAEAVAGHAHLHGRQAGRMVHVGPADAPVTRHEVMEAVRECASNRYTALDVLGWEWEHGLHDTVRDEARAEGVDLRLLIIPREVMDRRAVESGDVRFYELAYLKAVPEVTGRQVVIRLDDFIIPNPELVPDDVRAKITRWSDYVDFWAVDWNFGADGAGDTFHNEWQTYRTRGERVLRLVSDPHAYAAMGTYTILVKVIDIFGNDTTQLQEVSIA